MCSLRGIGHRYQHGPEVLIVRTCSGSFSLGGVKIQATHVEKDVGLETLFVSQPFLDISNNETYVMYYTAPFSSLAFGGGVVARTEALGGAQVVSRLASCYLRRCAEAA
jgi:hypothetical protein